MNTFLFVWVNSCISTLYISNCDVIKQYSVCYTCSKVKYMSGCTVVFANLLSEWIVLLRQKQTYILDSTFSADRGPIGGTCWRGHNPTHFLRSKTTVDWWC